MQYPLENTVNFGQYCLNTREVYNNFILELISLTDSEGNAIIEAQENYHGVLTLIYKKHASFTFSYHLTRILGSEKKLTKFLK